jgi:ribonucleoside-diphosphate reductase alpha chain
METMDIYSTAWKKGLKSTYYLHMKPRHTAEQSTVRVNKAEKLGKRGFAGLISEPEQVTVETVIAKSDAASTHATEVYAALPVSPATPVIATPAVATPATPTMATPAVAKTTSVPETTNESRILPPSDPQESLICDSCQ